MITDLLSGFSREPAECLVRINDTPIESLYPLLAEVTVETGRNAPDSATLTFETRRDERGEWMVQDATGLFDNTPLMREWNRISIVAAFGNHEEEVLRGFIRQLRAEYPEDAGAAKLVVECQDESLQLDREHRRISWGSEDLPTSDPQIIDETLARYPGLAGDPMNAAGQSTNRRSQPGRHRHHAAPGARRRERLRTLFSPRRAVLRPAARRPAAAAADALGLCRQGRQLHLDHRHRRRPSARRSRLRSAGRNRRRVERSARRTRSTAARH
jgi:hypothetical protein